MKIPITITPARPVDRRASFLVGYTATGFTLFGVVAFVYVAFFLK